MSPRLGEALPVVFRCSGGGLQGCHQSHGQAVPITGDVGQPSEGPYEQPDLAAQCKWVPLHRLCPFWCQETPFGVCLLWDATVGHPGWDLSERIQGSGMTPGTLTCHGPLGEHHSGGKSSVAAGG